MSPRGLSLKARALRFLAMREHSRAELARKLARHVEDTPEDPAGPHIERLLDELSAHGLLDEQRAADALVSAQAHRFGALQLRQRLRARGVAQNGPRFHGERLRLMRTPDHELSYGANGF